ncbi:MAG: hypothetical protein PWP47_518 [Synergistaceae bacterium]|nr:hypothetical protein [Synergistaceae bacterium]
MHLSVGALGGHGIEGVRHRKNSGFDADFIFFLSQGVAAAVDPFMMLEDNFRKGPGKIQGRKNILPEFGMFFYEFVFRRCEL